MKYSLLFLLFICIKLNPAQSKEISIDGARKSLGDGVIVVDIRREEEWQQTGVIVGSITSTFFDKNGNANVRSFLKNIREEASPEDTILLICRTGNRTRVVTKFLRENSEFGEVFSVSGGIMEWKRQGLKTISYP